MKNLINNKTQDFYVFYSKSKIVLILLCIFCLGFAIGCIKDNKDNKDNKEDKSNDSNEVTLVIESYNTDDFSPVKLAKMLEDLNVKYPHIVFAQSMVETGHWTSPLFIENNNLFGMKQARVRITTAQGTKNGHAYYKHWRDSVYDYAFYQSAYLKNQRNESEYLAYIGRNYAEAKHYVSTLKRIIKREDLKTLFG